MLDWYLQSANTARQLTSSDGHDVPPLDTLSTVTPMTFDSAAKALSWFATERVNLVNCTRAAAEQGYHQHVWRLAGCLNDMLNRYGDLHELVEVQSRGWRSAGIVGERQGEAGCLNNLGQAFTFLHEEVPAERFFQMALEIFREVGDVQGELVCRHNIGTTHLQRGNPAEAIRWYRESLSLATTLGWDWAVAHVVHRIGDVHLQMGQYDEAGKDYHFALSLRRQLGHTRGEAITLTQTGRLLLKQGRTDAAITYSRAALALHRQTLDRSGEAEALRILAEAEPSQSIRHLESAVTIFAELQDPQEHAATLELLGRSLHTAGATSRAKEALDMARRILTTLQAARDDNRAGASAGGIPAQRAGQAENNLPA
jgi:tetratricopeptide (TPR) repeat protein